jgi:hypothetical protein
MIYFILKKIICVIIIAKDGQVREVALHVELSWITVAINIACWEWHLRSAYQPTP